MIVLLIVLIIIIILLVAFYIFYKNVKNVKSIISVASNNILTLLDQKKELIDQTIELLNSKKLKNEFVYDEDEDEEEEEEEEEEEAYLSIFDDFDPFDDI